jgi:adenylate cyclase
MFKPAGKWPWGALAGAVLTAALGLLFHHFVLGRGLKQWSYSLLAVARAQPTPDDVLLIYMDEESHRALQQDPKTGWDRRLHARLLDALTAAGARAVVFDIVFSEAAARPEDDETLAAAIRRNGNVIIAADPVRAAERPGLRIDASSAHMPYSVLRDALRHDYEDVGTSETRPDEDLIIRQHFHQETNFITSLAWAAARHIGVPIAQNQSGGASEKWVNYYGAPGALHSLSYVEALDTNVTPAAAFRDKVVFVGARLLTRFAGERKDEFVSPYSYWAQRDEERFISGVEVQATLFLNLLRGEWLERFPREIEGWIIGLLGLFYGFVLVQCRPLIATLAAFFSAVLWMLAAYALLVTAKTWFPWLIPVGLIGFALSFSIIFNSVQLYVQKRLFEHTLGLYLSPKLVKKFSGDARTMEEFLKPGAQKQMLTILFSDIANFTSISEGLDSDELALAMNAYFEQAIATCIHPTDGTVVKYIGDAIYAFWNAPESQADHAWRACTAALTFSRQTPLLMNGQPLLTRLGLHTGEANVGNFGSTARFDYTALGESVNLASRMEGLNKYLGTTVLATGETCRAVADKIVTRFAGNFRLKGFERLVEVHELIGFAAEAEESCAWREQFAEGLRQFGRRDFDAAERAFRSVIQRRGGDGPSNFYLLHLAELRQQPPTDGWAGEIELKEK